MSAGMPELGSKISLISRSDIRYEGRLFTVDPKECTIALASVRSFGTENRETNSPVPAQNQVYDYILFRGQDIKDIRILNHLPLNDPAIMQLTVPPSLSQQGAFPSGHPVLAPMAGPQMNHYGNSYGLGGMSGLTSNLSAGMGVSREPARQMSQSDLIVPGPAPTEQPNVLSSPIVEPPRPSEHHASVLDLIGGGTRSTTPASLSSRKSPTVDQGTQVGGKNQKTVKPMQPPSQRTQQQRNSRERTERRDNNRSDNQFQPQNRQGPPNRNQNPVRYNQQGNNQQRPQQHNNWPNNGQQLRQRGRPRPGNFNSKTNPQKKTLKFDVDYDFEQANTEFEELRSQFSSKVKVTEEVVEPKPEANGEVEKKDDSGNETIVGENEVDEEQEVFYDKTKSFFDKISCEAVERAKGKSQRTDWRTERKLNSETFGVSATRRGNYRGRGGFRPGPPGLGYRGNNYNNYNNYNRGGYRQQPQQRRDQQGNQRMGYKQNLPIAQKNTVPKSELGAQEN